METFGDTEPADQYSSVRDLDALQVARKLQQIRRRVGAEQRDWLQLSAPERARALEVAELLVEWLHREGQV